MKKIFFSSILFLFAISVQAQVEYNKLTPDFSGIAAEAFTKIRPATKKWFEVTVAMHPPGNFNESWTRQQLMSEFGETSMQELFVLMMAYMKMVAKEVREDKKIANASKELSLAAKEEKLKMENQKIEKQKEEANEKADMAMQSANTSLATGIVGGVIQAAGRDSVRLEKKPDSVISKVARTNINNRPLEEKQPVYQQKEEALKKVQYQLEMLKQRKNY